MKSVTLFKDMVCPDCGKSGVLVSILDSFITEAYVDIPAKCYHCDVELRVVYDITKVEVD